MKKVIVLCACLLVAVMCLSGCQGVGTTSKYRAYSAFAQSHKPGMSKEKVFEKMGCPYSYRDDQGNFMVIDTDDRGDFEDSISAETAAIWYYDCYELPDPANPYRLTVVFDENGKTVSAEMNAVLGG